MKKEEIHAGNFAISLISLDITESRIPHNSALSGSAPTCCFFSPFLFYFLLGSRVKHSSSLAINKFQRHLGLI
jgi:hypothetical protein